MDSRVMIGHIAAKYDVKLDENDPAFILVEMNRVMLESAFAEYYERMYESNMELKNSIVELQKANEDLKYSADKVVEDKLQGLDKAMTATAETAMVAAIDKSFAKNIAAEVVNLKKKINGISDGLDDALEGSRESYIKVAGIGGLAGGLMGALLVILFNWGASNNEVSATDKTADAAPVTQTASNAKQNPKR